MTKSSQFLPWLKRFWVLMVAAPLLTFIQRGSGSRFITTVALYLAGWLLLRVALVRDPVAKGLESFLQSKFPRVLGAGIVLSLVALVALGMTVDGVLDILLALSVGWFAIWAAMRTAERMIRSLQNIVAMVVSVIVALVGGEIICRLPVVVARTGGNTPGMIKWQLTHYDDVVMKKNALDLRSLHLEKAKAQGVYRVVVLGDSFTWGDKIARTQDTWPYIVEQTLREKNIRAEVINMGHTGFTSVNEAELLDRQGWSFDPDLIMIGYNLNDPLPSGPNYYREGEDWLFRANPLLPVFDGFLDRHSYLFSFLNAQYKGFQLPRTNPDGYAPLYADNFEGWKQCQEALRKIGAEARMKGIPVVLAIFPSFVPGKMDDSSYPYLALHRKVTNLAETAGLHVVDLRFAYSKFDRPGRTWWAMPCDPHPSVEGHRVAGQTIGANILEMLAGKNTRSTREAEPEGGSSPFALQSR